MDSIEYCCAQMVSPPLIPEQRQRELLRLVRGAGVLSTRHLAALLDVSNMTVRRDISGLEEAGLVESVLGGVRLREGMGGSEPPRERRSRAALELPRKRAIAALAASMVSDGMVVFLDAGTTCQEVAALLTPRTALTVVTNDLYTALDLAEHPGVDVLHTGGALDPASGSTSGPLAAAMLENVRLDTAFLSTGSWDATHGMTTHDLDKVTLKTRVMSAAATSILLADSTKYGTAERYKVAALADIDIVISDADLEDADLSTLSALGAEVRLAQAS